MYAVGRAGLTLLHASQLDLPRGRGFLQPARVSLSGVIAAILSLDGRRLLPAWRCFQFSPFGGFALANGCAVGLAGCDHFLVGIATSLYSFTEAPAKVSVSFFTHLFMAAMVLVVTVTNAFFFLIFWELMTLASYFLVMWEFEKNESAQTGFIYFLVAHIGAALIMVAFFLFFRKTGTFDFAAHPLCGAFSCPQRYRLCVGSSWVLAPRRVWCRCISGRPTPTRRAQSYFGVDVFGHEEDRHLRHPAYLRGLVGCVDLVVGIYSS